MSSPRLSVDIGEVEGIPIVRAFGEIDLYTVPEFDHALKDAMEHRSPAVIADLSGASYLDSAGLSTLLGAYKAMSGRGGMLYVVAPPGSPGVRRVLEVTRLDMLMRVRDSLEDALQELRVKQAA